MVSVDQWSAIIPRLFPDSAIHLEKRLISDVRLMTGRPFPAANNPPFPVPWKFNTFNTFNNFNSANPGQRSTSPGSTGEVVGG